MENNKPQYTPAIVIMIASTVNILMITIPFALIWCFYYPKEMMIPFYYKGNFIVIGLFITLYSSCGKAYDKFLFSLVSISEMIYSQIITLFTINSIIYVVMLLLIKKSPDITPMIIVFPAQLFLSFVWAKSTRRWYFSHFSASKTAIISGEKQGLEKQLNKHGIKNKFDIITIKDCLSNMDMLNDVETIFLSGICSTDRNIILKHCIFNGISVFSTPKINDLIMPGAKKIQLPDQPVQNTNRYSPSSLYLAEKRAMDIVLSLIALIVLSPVMLVTAVAIKATDGGPVFYTQERLTKDGKKFRIHKFRSMIVDAEKDGIARLSSGDSDDRITPVGRFIRKVKIDELPQLIDILAGNMSLVGPRPERPELAARYQKELPEFALRLQAKAGLTGYRQVFGGYNTSPHDKLQMDLMYMSNPSLLFDIQIMLATIKIIFMIESTESIDKNAATDSIEKYETIKN